MYIPSKALGKDSIPHELKNLEIGEKKFEEGDMAAALKIFMDVAQSADKQHNEDLACLAYYNIGVTYFSMLCNGDALKNFQKAYDLCLHNNLGPGREAEILGGISGVFFQLENFKKAKQTLQKAIEISKNNNDSVMLATLAGDMALLCNKTCEFDSVAHWIDFAKNYSNSEKNAFNLLEIAAETAMLRHDYNRAQELCLEILSYPQNTYPKRELPYIYLMQIATDKKLWTEAVHYEEMAANVKELRMRTFFFETASQMRQQMGDLKSALAFKDSLIIYRDSIENLNNSQLINNENIKFEVMKYRLEAERILDKQKSRTLAWLSIACAFLFLLIICALLWRQQRHRHVTEQQMMVLKLEKEHKEKELAEERMHETELIAHHKHEILQKEIERQNTQMQANAMFVSSRNQLIENLLKYIDNIHTDADLPEIRNLRQHLGRMLGKDSKEHEEFMLNVEAADPELSRKLLAVHPDLLQSDIKFLGYIKMNMSMKEIAAIMNINPDSCKRRKIRISKKLGLESSADLYTYLLNL